MNITQLVAWRSRHGGDVKFCETYPERTTNSAELTKNHPMPGNFLAHQSIDKEV